MDISTVGNLAAWLEMPATIGTAAPTVSASTHQRRGLLRSGERMATQRFMLMNVPDKLALFFHPPLDQAENVRRDKRYAR